MTSDERRRQQPDLGGRRRARAKAPHELAAITPCHARQCFDRLRTGGFQRRHYRAAHSVASYVRHQPAGSHSPHRAGQRGELHEVGGWTARSRTRAWPRASHQRGRDVAAPSPHHGTGIRSAQHCPLADFARSRKPGCTGLRARIQTPCSRPCLRYSSPIEQLVVVVVAGRPEILGSISRRGNRYPFVQGARSVQLRGVASSRRPIENRSPSNAPSMSYSQDAPATYRGWSARLRSMPRMNPPSLSEWTTSPSDIIEEAER